MIKQILTILLGIGIGIGLGIFFGWVVWPLEYSQATPQLLNETHKQDYALMIATIYAKEKDLPLAQQQVAQLGNDGGDYIFDLMLDMILSQNNPPKIEQIVLLADALGYYSPAMQPYLPTEEVPNAP